MRVRDESGVVMPARLLVLSISAVALGGLAFIASQPDPKPETAAVVAAAPTPTPTLTPSAAPTTPAVKPVRKVKPRPKPKPVIKRSETYVEVYNNSGIPGLAGEFASRAAGAGWSVVGSDNWYGTIASSTVYYPPRLEAAAKALSRDLGINGTKPAIAPMRFDRLTLILTGDAR